MGVRERLGYELSMIGDRIGIDRLTYNGVILEMYDRMARADAPAVIGALRQAFPAAGSVLDVGSGSGAYAAEAQRQGLEVVAVERSAHGRRIARSHGVGVHRFDLTDDPPAALARPVDLAYCFEVAEHIPAELAPALVSFLHLHGERILLTAATPGQGGTGHINEQPTEYWCELFASHGRQPRDPKPFVSRLPLAKLSHHWSLTSILVF